MTKAMLRWSAFGCALIIALAVPVRGQETAPAAPEAQAAEAEAEAEKAWSVEFGLDYSTLYMFRGLNLLGEDQEVWTPRASFTYGNWSIWYYGYLGKFDAFDEDGNQLDDGSYHEADFGTDYTFSIGEKFGLTLGVLTYMYDGETERGLGYLDTYEVYGIAAWDTLLAPTVSYYYDFDQVEGGFLSLDLSHEFALSEKVGLNLSGQLGVDFGYNQPGDPEAGIDASDGNGNHVMVGADVPWQITDAFSVHGLVQHFISLDVAEDLEQPDETVLTVGATYSF